MGEPYKGEIVKNTQRVLGGDWLSRDEDVEYNISYINYST